MEKNTLLQRLVRDYKQNHRESERIYKKALQFQIKGGSHNLRLFSPFPFFDRQCLGSKVKDVDGHTYVDFWQGHFANVLGHNPPVIRDSLVRYMKEGYGLMTGFPGLYQSQLAELILNTIPADKIRFTTSGTLASMYAVMLAKAYTNRELIMKAGGGWHGAQPYALKGISSYDRGLDHVESAGLPTGMENTILITQFNDTEDLEKKFMEYGERISCLLMEPFVGAGGFIFATPEYLQKARELTRRYGVVLVLDEVISGFRFHAGGLQSLYKVKPELSILGKAIGGGMPLSALAGKKEIMNLCDPEVKTSQKVKFEGGTFSAHPGSVYAGLNFLSHLIENQDEIYPQIGRMGKKVRQGIENIFTQHGFNVQCTGGDETLVPYSSMVGVHFLKKGAGPINSPNEACNPEISDIDMRESLFKLAMLEEGFNTFHGYGAISYAHSYKEIQESLEAVERIVNRWERYKLKF
ncbi:aminotransferase class III-fold pyridoxal phosphate-dependent enzyme [bacterium]|nr:aminotransferase class III-fold pyridoxal phosphate-dependent enzyme [bacterium]